MRSHLTSIVTLCLALLLGLACDEASCRSEEAREGSLLVTTVHGGLALDSDVPADEIDVEILDDGRVQLSGEVDTLLAKRSALATTMEIPGVIGVIDRIEIEDRRISDEHLQQQVNQALTVDPGTVLDLRADVADHVATLRGTVRSPEEREHATEVAASVPGIRDVRNLAEIRQSAAAK